MKISYLLKIILPMATAAMFMQGSIVKAATFDVFIIANGPGQAVFNPRNITIAAGDTVTWHWPEMVCSHSVTSGADCQSNGFFDSAVHNAANFIFTHTFSSPGTFDYFSSTECTVAVGSVTVAPPPSASQLLNISTRMRVEVGDNVLIGGFIVTGNAPKKVIVRAIAPSLPVPGKLADPILELHDSTGGILATNDNWMDAPNKQAIIDSTVPPSNDLESAILTTLPAGNAGYTAIMRGVGDTTGVALIEVYDLDQSADSQLANISTRGIVKTDSDVMIGGFILGPDGAGAANVLIRALGPSLAGNVSGVLADPVLELHDANGALVMTNDNWKSSQQTEIEATNIPPSNDLESAMVVSVPAAAYTAIVSGKNRGTGVGLVEVYRLP